MGIFNHLTVHIKLRRGNVHFPKSEKQPSPRKKDFSLRAISMVTCKFKAQAVLAAGILRKGKKIIVINNGKPSSLSSHAK